MNCGESITCPRFERLKAQVDLGLACGWFKPVSLRSWGYILKRKVAHAVHTPISKHRLDIVLVYIWSFSFEAAWCHTGRYFSRLWYDISVTAVFAFYLVFEKYIYPTLLRHRT